MRDRVRWGILGTGRIARQFALDLRTLPGAELAAVGSRDPARARELAAQLGASRAWGSYEELAADPAVDVVYVATPNSEHRAGCLLALRAAKAVLCEKPFATNAREAREVVALAREKRVFCMEALWTRFLPLVDRVLALVREGRIGEPLAFRADFGIAVASREDRVFRAELGGGALLDLGVYLVAMARAFLGPSLEAGGYARLGATGVDEQACVQLRHAHERHSQLFASLLSDTRAEAVVVGTQGRLRLHAPFYRPHRASLETFRARGAAPSRPTGSAGRPVRDSLRNAYRRFDELLDPLLRRPTESFFEPVVGNGYQYQAAEVARCLRAGETESPRLPLDETVAVLEVLDGLRAAWGVRFPADQA